MVIGSSVVLRTANSACRGICVFKWSGVHFDKIYEDVTVLAVGITSLPSDTDVILVVLQKKVQFL